METFHILQELKKRHLTTLNAGYRVYLIKQKKKVDVDGQDCLGAADFDAGEIVIKDSLPHEDARETLLHEIMHVVLEVCGLGDSTREPDYEVIRTNEELVTLITRGLLLFMNLNPELIALLNEQPPKKTPK